MDIKFANKQIEKICSTRSAAVKEIGSTRAKNLFMRLNQIKTANAVEELKLLPGKFHELHGDRIGQWACNLDANWRLVFTPRTDKYATVIAEIEGIIDYH